MYDWKDIEEARQRRQQLLQDAGRFRMASGLGRGRKRRASVLSVLLWELARDLGRARKLFRRRHARG